MPNAVDCADPSPQGLLVAAWRGLISPALAILDGPPRWDTVPGDVLVAAAFSDEGAFIRGVLHERTASADDLYIAAGLACENGSASALEALLDAGAALIHPTRSNNSCLLGHAVGGNQLGCLEQLIARGALENVDAAGQALCDAAANNQHDVLDSLLDALERTPNPLWRGHLADAVHGALLSGCGAVADQLIGRGAVVRATALEDLWLAAKHGVVGEGTLALALSRPGCLDAAQAEQLRAWVLTDDTPCLNPLRQRLLLQAQASDANLSATLHMP